LWISVPLRHLRQSYVTWRKWPPASSQTDPSNGHQPALRGLHDYVQLLPTVTVNLLECKEHWHQSSGHFIHEAVTYYFERSGFHQSNLPDPSNYIPRKTSRVIFDRTYSPVTVGVSALKFVYLKGNVPWRIFPSKQPTILFDPLGEASLGPMPTALSVVAKLIEFYFSTTYGKLIPYLWLWRALRYTLRY